MNEVKFNMMELKSLKSTGIAWYFVMTQRDRMARGEGDQVR